MLKKKKISAEPETYQLFEVLPTLDPIFLGLVTHKRDELWQWESRWGFCRGEADCHTAINMVAIAASKTDYIRGVKKRGMR
jgi:hypothetical protein